MQPGMNMGGQPGQQYPTPPYPGMYIHQARSHAEATESTASVDICDYKI